MILTYPLWFGSRILIVGCQRSSHGRNEKETPTSSQVFPPPPQKKTWAEGWSSIRDGLLQPQSSTTTIEYVPPSLAWCEQCLPGRWTRDVLRPAGSAGACGFLNDIHESTKHRCWVLAGLLPEMCTYISTRSGVYILRCILYVYIWPASPVAE